MYMAVRSEIKVLCASSAITRVFTGSGSDHSLRHLFNLSLSLRISGQVGVDPSRSTDTHPLYSRILSLVHSGRTASQVSLKAATSRWNSSQRRALAGLANETNLVDSSIVVGNV